MKWLVTAFAPFGGARTNSSLILLEQLRKQSWNGRIQFHAPVPVEFAGAWNNIREVLENDRELDGLLALGQAESRSRISLERVGLNWTDARIADNAGFLPAQGPIRADAANMHMSNIPWENLASSTLSERSYSAGTYVCNAVLYEALDWALPLGKKAGFVHIPVLSSQTDAQFDKYPKVDDQAALEEVGRILEFVLNL